jgi:4'-phosphopantetheinyl transferase
MRPALGEVHVWYRRTESLDEVDVSADVVVLNADERARLERFVFQRDRRDFAAAHALLRRVLSFYESVPPSAWRFTARALGKPAIVSTQAGHPPLRFNLSHTDGLVACVVARDVEVGIDVERISHASSDRDLARQCFTAREIEHLDACEPDERMHRFVELWTLKESYLKALGTGLYGELKSFSFEFGRDRTLTFHPPPGDRRPWQFALAAPTACHHLAVSLCEKRGLRCRTLFLMPRVAGARCAS